MAALLTLRTIFPSWYVSLLLNLFVVLPSIVLVSTYSR